MKKIMLLIVFALSLTLCLGVTSIATSDKHWYESEKTTDSYKFPITPTKTPEKWKEFQTHQEMLDACQIPDEILKNMTTEGLIETCLSYPMMGDMMLSNSTYQGFIRQVETFNGLKELLNREDAGRLLCEKYYNLSFDELLKTDDYPTFRLRYFEFIISQPNILSKMDKTNKKKLLDYSIKIAFLKSDKYSDKFSILSTALIAGRILMDNKDFRSFMEENKEVKLFLETGTNFTSKTFKDILQQKELFEKFQKQYEEGDIFP